ncbi:glycosyltransferase family 2 protein [Brachybacterium halotolerans subsp. kimchii]|uniref:glycosyltransferase family 2 protein n=1 Tax=Brachybacterium halotolerans TaxID=2795215 RepID=UPI001E2ECD97|nr:glycosyltransferase family A protein [Brachybacterium halotolerans]UEJ81131.1 glycosyltransferase family 2 protein [Brachybacterium halotolerans subsp. kimchii]
MIEVSVVVCARNEEARIGRQLAALDAQVDHPRFEVIVVDDGSTDRTRDVVRAWIERGGGAAESAHLLHKKSRRGIPASRNRGASRARGRLIAYCDADDEVEQEWVGAMARGLGEDQVGGGPLLIPAAEASGGSTTFADGPVGTAYLPYIGAASLVIERAALHRLGGFDESLPPYGFEDVDLCWRAQEAGMELVRIPDARVRYSLSGASASVRKKLTLGRGRVLMARRYPSYDPATYTPASTLKGLVGAVAGIVVASARERRIDRRRVGTAVAAAGRVIGALQVPAGRPLPPPRLPLEAL